MFIGRTALKLQTLGIPILVSSERPQPVNRHNTHGKKPRKAIFVFLRSAVTAVRPSAMRQGFMKSTSFRARGLTAVSRVPSEVRAYIGIADKISRKPFERLAFLGPYGLETRPPSI